VKARAAFGGPQHHHRLRLDEAGEVLHVGVLAERVHGVAVARGLRQRGDDEHRARADRLGDGGATGREDRLVEHGAV
jgi:hypothetical protein